MLPPLFFSEGELTRFPFVLNRYLRSFHTATMPGFRDKRRTHGVARLGPRAARARRPSVLDAAPPIARQYVGFHRRNLRPTVPS